MPLYEYQCEKCAHRFEVIQKFSDAPIAVCPKCGGPVVKLLSSPAIQFKGSGWYITDYARTQGSTGQQGQQRPRARELVINLVVGIENGNEDRVEGRIEDRHQDRNEIATSES